MARADGNKKAAFEMWVKGKSLKEIQDEIGNRIVTKRQAVRGWVVEWERGRQRKWEPEGLENREGGSGPAAGPSPPASEGLHNPAGASGGSRA